MAKAHTLKIKLQLLLGEDIAMGPGKAELLEAIVEEGSISAAGRALGMSYRRAWLLVDTMNRSFRERLVATTPGGAKTGGARLTATGLKVLADYRAVQAAVADAAECAALKSLQRRLRTSSTPSPQSGKRR
jgi:molybdate transport system regulatory protein